MERQEWEKLKALRDPRNTRFRLRDNRFENSKTHELGGKKCKQASDGALYITDEHGTLHRVNKAKMTKGEKKKFQADRRAAKAAQKA